MRRFSRPFPRAVPVSLVLGLGLAQFVAGCGLVGPTGTRAPSLPAGPAMTSTPIPTAAPTAPAHTSGEVLDVQVVRDAGDAWLAPPEGFAYVAIKLHLSVGRDLAREEPVFTLETSDAGFGTADEAIKTPTLAPLPDGFEQQGWITFVVDASLTSADLHIVYGPSLASSVTILVSWDEK